MDKSYAMAKFGMESKNILKSKQKGCWHYMKYFFFFSSIIQFLIILGLVLFMLYGNAHGGTELRLKSVENRYHDLTIDHAWLKGNFTLLRAKLAISEKEGKNCSDILLRMRATAHTMNRTNFCPRLPPMPPNCNYMQAILDQQNMNCTAERLKLENSKMADYIKFSKEIDSCTKAMNEYASKDRIVGSENTQLQRETKDLGKQIKYLQDSCTTIDEKFKLELQNLRNIIESNLKPADTYDLYPVRCKPLTDTINNRIDITLNRIRQDVTHVVLENSELKAAKDRINEDLGKCSQDKGVVTGERNNLVADKTALDKQLRDKTDELNKSYAQFMRKTEELESCRRLQVQVRPQGFPPLRPGDIGKRK